MNILLNNYIYYYLIQMEIVKLDCEFNPAITNKEELFDYTELSNNNSILSNNNYEILLNENNNIICRDKITDELVEYIYLFDKYLNIYYLSMKRHIKNNQLYLHYRIPPYCLSIYEKTYIVKDKSGVTYKIWSCVDVNTNIVEEINIKKVNENGNSFSFIARYKFDSKGNSRDCETFNLINDLSLNDRIDSIRSIYFN